MNRISDETMEYIGILAKLTLSEEEKEQAKQDMERMLDYVDRLNELDTTGVEPMSHIFPIHNVFREDIVTYSNETEQDAKTEEEAATERCEAALANAPAKKDGMYKVPKTVE